jgi:hypothetical protein
MSKAEEYRKLAAEARKRAEESNENSAAKAMYEQLARNWDELAAGAEHHNGRLTPKP